jgi:CheY-like chemotaxis protein
MKKVNCILLIDDNEADNIFHSRVIRKAGVCDHVEIANDGQEALNYLAKCVDGQFLTPDIIFLDINMPGMNGFEFLEEYAKLDLKLKSKMVVFMLTSSFMPEDSEKAMKTGDITEFLNKPLTVKMVQDIVEKCI